MYEKLSDEIIDDLWSQEIDMDDWDYVLFLEEQFKDEFFSENQFDLRGNLQCNSWQIDKLLQGGCSNVWYSIKDFMGRKGVLGIAYHS